MILVILSIGIEFQRVAEGQVLLSVALTRLCVTISDPDDGLHRPLLGDSTADHQDAEADPEADDDDDEDDLEEEDDPNETGERGPDGRRDG